jgi:hypothetical protein
VKGSIVSIRFACQQSQGNSFLNANFTIFSGMTLATGFTLFRDTILLGRSRVLRLRPVQVRAMHHLPTGIEPNHPSGGWKKRRSEMCT